MKILPRLLLLSLLLTTTAHAQITEEEIANNKQILKNRYGLFIQMHKDMYVNRIGLCCGFIGEPVKNPVMKVEARRQYCSRIPIDQEDECK